MQGAGHRHRRPQLLLWGCDDLTNWVPLGALLTDDDPVAAEVAPANIWECPNLSVIDVYWVLLVSLWRWRDDTHELAGVRYLVGDLVPAGPGLRFRASSGGLVDTGTAFYAPQLLAEAGRTLLWGWAWEVDRSDEQLKASGWAGTLTFPRELSVRDGVLRSVPAAELLALRREEVPCRRGTPVVEAAFEVLARGPVRLLRTGTPHRGAVLETVGTRDEPARILVDGSIVETFAAGAAATDRIYPGAGTGWLVEADAADVTVFRLGH